MSDTPKYVVPAYELLKALYQPEEAQEVFNTMSEEEKEKINYLMTLLNSRRELSCRPYSFTDNVMKRVLLHKPIVVKNFLSTEKVSQYLYYLGYSTNVSSMLISPGETIPVLVINQ